MKINELDNKLSQTVQDFNRSVEELFPQSSGSHPDYVEMLKFTDALSTALTDFQKNIIEYLKEQS